MPENGETCKNVVRSRTLPDVGGGEYDALFHGAPDKPSHLYRAAKNPPAPPTVRLLKSSVPLRPELVIPKDYSPLARVTGIEGIVSFTIEVSSDGSATNLVSSDGHPLLRPSVTDVVSRWRFPEESAGQQIQITIEFALNCPPKVE
jgi:outer membrane biosynthesis protein TonB